METAGISLRRHPGGTYYTVNISLTDKTENMATEYRDKNEGYMEEQELRRDFDEYGNPLPERDATGFMEAANSWSEPATWESMGR